MMKNYFIWSITSLILCFTTHAQVTNGNFENIKPNFIPSNWGMDFTRPAILNNETGQVIIDPIQFTGSLPYLVYATTEAKTGQYAMEISNAFNTIQNRVIPGIATLFNDSEQDSPGWNPGVPVAIGTSVVLLGFDYKFLPVGNDIAEATLEVVDAEGNEIGKASIDISGWQSTFTTIYAPITITNPGTPAYMYISFNMAKEGSLPSFGSRLIIDNVVVNFSSLITVENPEQDVKVFPTYVDNAINIIPSGLSGAVSYSIINAEGKKVLENTVNEASAYIYTMEVGGLSAGVYFLNIQDKTKNYIKKFIKK